MAVNPTLSNFKGFTFDGVSSKTFGIYLTGETVFDAPVRDVEMISIPGRNGSYALDRGRFDNIALRYSASLPADSEVDFAQAVSDLRNYLCSKVGYQRLEDEYNPDEYRLAIYKSGLEVSPTLLKRGTFEIMFECKPQRFLKSGETATSKANNSTITNPTLFDAHPLLQFTSNGNDGTINLGSQQIKVLNALMGQTDLNLQTTTGSGTGYASVHIVTILNTGVYNTGDTITFKGARASYQWFESDKPGISYSNPNGLNCETQVSGQNVTARLTATDTTFTAGTSATVTKSVDITIRPLHGTADTRTITLSIQYNGSSTITVRWIANPFSRICTFNGYRDYTATVNSTKNTLTGTIYLDLDIGEAYKIDGGNTVSLNNFVNLGADLPVLPSGNTTITYTNVSNFKITPRWWKV